MMDVATDTKREEAVAIGDAQPQALMPPVEHVKRLKTHGEKKFDWLTYGGFALVGNEATSLLITSAAEDKHGNARGIYKPFKEFFTKMKNAPPYVKEGRLPGVLAAVIGGMFMVPFVKHMEGNKGEKVRNYDRKYYGDLVDKDPAIIAAHKEMDDAPKQSWGSLWKGRVATVVAALTVDATIGWDKSLITKLFKPDSKAVKFATMDGIASKIANVFVGNAAENKSGLFKFTGEGQKSARYWVKQGSWLMVLSTTLTVLFYASSKLFAQRRDDKIERREAKQEGRAAVIHHENLLDDVPEVAATKAEAVPGVDAAKTEETPTTRIHAPQHDAMLHMQQLAAHV